MKQLTQVIVFIAVLSVCGLGLGFPRESIKKTTDTFMCPEEYPTIQEYVASAATFITQSLEASPSMTLEDILKARNDKFIVHDCHGRNDVPVGNF